MKDNEKKNRDEKRIVVTMSIGDDPFARLSHPLFVEYAKKVGAKFDLIKKEKYFIKPTKNCPKSILFEKLQLKEYLAEFDRVLFVDSDVLIDVDCAPDLFAIVKPGYIGALYEDTGNRKKQRRNLMRSLQEDLGDVGWRKGYINSGVLIFDTSHRQLFDYQLKEDHVISRAAMSDQDIVNYNIKKYKYSVHNIGYKFNHMSMFSERGYNYLTSYFIHYAGRGFDPRISRHEQMKRDLVIIKTKNKFQRCFMSLYPRMRLVAIGLLNLYRSLVRKEKDFVKEIEEK